MATPPPTSRWTNTRGARPVPRSSYTVAHGPSSSRVPIATPRPTSRWTNTRGARPVPRSSYTVAHGPSSRRSPSERHLNSNFTSRTSLPHKRRTCSRPKTPQRQGRSPDNYKSSWSQDLTSMTLLVKIRGVETTQFMYSGGKCIKEEVQPTYLLPFSPGVTYQLPKKNFLKKKAKESKLQPSQLLPTTPSWASMSKCGCDCRQCTLSLLIPQIKNQRSKLQPSITEMVVVCKLTFRKIRFQEDTRPGKRRSNFQLVDAWSWN